MACEPLHYTVSTTLYLWKSKMDLRLHFHELIQSHRLFLNSVVSVGIVTTAVIGFSLELNKTCQPDLKFWLIVLSFRLTMRLIVRLYVEAIVLDYIYYSGDIHVFGKIIEILDVFGMVWFAVGNLLVLNNFECSKIAPINYYLGLIYIVGTYVVYITSFFWKCLLKMCPPPGIRGDEDNNEITSKFSSPSITLPLTHMW